MKIKTQRNIINNQAGMASMVIVILIMTVLTLIVLSLTQNSNREQRQALDRQLNSQAFYAAESGVSDAKDYVSQNPTTAPQRTTDCDSLPGAAPGQIFPGKPSRVGQATLDENIRYSCVLYDQHVRDILIGVGTNHTETIPIQHSNHAENIGELTISWVRERGVSDDQDVNVENFSTCLSAGPANTLPANLHPDCEAGVVRAVLVNPSVGGGLNSRRELLDNSLVAFLRPTTSGAVPSIDYGNSIGSVSKQGQLVSGSCSGNQCTVKITGINRAKLYLQLRSIYKANQVTVTGTTTAGNPIEFDRAQMSIDSTGRANDVVKRIEVRVRLSGINSESVPSFALQATNDICKRLKVRPSAVTEDCNP